MSSVHSSLTREHMHACMLVHSHGWESTFSYIVSAVNIQTTIWTESRWILKKKKARTVLEGGRSGKTEEACCPRRPWSPSSQLVPTDSDATNAFTHKRAARIFISACKVVCLLITQYSTADNVAASRLRVDLHVDLPSGLLPLLGEQSSHLTTRPLTVNSLWLAIEALQSPCINIWE